MNGDEERDEREIDEREITESIVRDGNSVNTTINSNGWQKIIRPALDNRLKTLIEDFWTLNYEKDIIDGPVKPPKDYFAGSEKFFFEVWRAQRTGNSVTNFSMVHLDSRNIKKLSFLVEVFNNISFLDLKK